MAAAQTPDSTKEESLGSRKLLIVKFDALVTGDTWVSGLGYTVLAHWVSVTTAPGTQTNCGGMASYAPSTGTFTFIPDEDTQDMQLFILV